MWITSQEKAYLALRDELGDVTLQAFADRLGVTRQRVGQLEQRLRSAQAWGRSHRPWHVLDREIPDLPRRTTAKQAVKKILRGT